LIKFLNSESEYVQWLELTDIISSVNKTVLFGCVYVPSENSKYSSEEAFNEIENEYIDFSKNFEHSLLIGDYNAKTSDLNDFLIPNENLLEILDIADDDELLKEFYDYENLLRCWVPLLRYTQDKSRPNKFGCRLLKLCQNCSLYIANSRICKDKGIGKCTCKGSTVGDYV